MTREDPLTTHFLPSEQFRMRRLQVFNWGTFSGLHEIPIAEKGFMVVGRSGSGKSTLLDAISTLLIPPRWLDFNAAARDVDKNSRDRSLITYVRGAWAEQKEDNSGEIVTRYLRPGTTWSAIALTYCNGKNQTVILVQLFLLRGNANSAADVKRHYLIFEQPFDLNELKHFDLDVRKLKQHYPDVFFHQDFRPYCDRFCRLLGIQSEIALRLLHKTQSAKNLGDLNFFLRDFMLDKPVTFEIAERLIEDFAELKTAHQAVVTAREQMQILQPAREKKHTLDEVAQKIVTLNELQQGMDSYRENCRISLLKENIASLTLQTEGLQGMLCQQETVLHHLNLTLRDLEQQHRTLGGENIERWEIEIKNLDLQKKEKQRKCEQAQLACQALGLTLTTSPTDFATLIHTARQELENWQQQRNDLQTIQFDLMAEKKESEKEFTSIVKEVEILRRQPSNIPAHMLELRSQLARALKCHEESLPFVGELIQVRPEEAAWQGAIERLLHGFALSMLIEEDHYAVFAQHINQANLQGRLVYFRMGKVESAPVATLSPDLLFHKLQLKECVARSWLESELKQRFHYACVESLQAFRHSERALTREGQIKHSKTRHEKDDRYAIYDRRHWVLGFNNLEKRTIFEQQAQMLAQKIEHLSQEMALLNEKSNQLAARAIHCQTLANLQFQEIDVIPLSQRIALLQQHLLAASEGNLALQDLQKQIQKQRIIQEKAEETLKDLRVKQQMCHDEITRKQQKLAQLLVLSNQFVLTEIQQTELTALFKAQANTWTLENIDAIATRVERGLNEELKRLSQQNHQLEKNIENYFSEFKRRWPLNAAEMDPSLASASDFFAVLQRLENDDLPAYETRFFDLLQSQSHQNLAALATHLNQARKAIFERMELVNASLSQAAFNPGTTLYIETKDRQLTEVKEFKQEIQEVLSHAWSPQQEKEHKEQAEHRFLILQQLVDRLASQELEQRRWREIILDVRQHVEFIGRELDKHGKEVEVYRSGAGKSGGQRQKLATTCLAAALRYQLGSDEHPFPIYAPVVMDEAFDKADNEFTALAMNIFIHFGFQMIVATPLRSIMTLEPFINGACFVEISERRHSGVLLIAYDNEQQRLQLPIHHHDHEHTLTFT